MKNIIKPILTLSFLLTTLISSEALALPGSQLKLHGNLYDNGRPTNNEPGHVRDFVGWRNCLYVSFATLDGVYHLDVWNTKDLAAPKFIEEHSYGTTDDDKFVDGKPNPLPSAHLKSPRDLNVNDGHLVLWSNNEAHVYDLKTTCGLGTQSTFTFSNGIEGLGIGRLSHASQMASSNRFDGAKTEYYTINLQDPRKPFEQAIGLLPKPLSGTYQGLPALLDLSQDKSEVSLTTFKQERKAHVTTYWDANILGDIFKISNRNLTIRQLILSAIPDDYLQKQQDRLLDILATGSASAEEVKAAKKKKRKKKAKKKKNKAKKNKGKKKKKKKRKKKKKKKRKKKKKKKGNDEDDNSIETPKPSVRLGTLATNKYEKTKSLPEVLDDLGISDNDSLEQAIEKLVAAQLSNQLDEILRQNVLADLMGRWEDAFLTLSKAPLSEVRTKLTATLNARLNSVGLVTFLLEHIMAPLVDNPEYMRYTLGQSIDLMVDNSVAQTIDGLLGGIHTAITLNGVLTFKDFDAPACLSIPNSSKAFLELLLVDTGPRLNKSSPAFWEVLKLVQFYFGETDFSKYEAEINTEIRKLHDSLAGEVIQELVGFVDRAQDVQSTVNQFYSRFGTDFSLKPVLAELITEIIIDNLKEHSSADPTQSLNEFLKSQGIYIDAFDLPEGEKLATMADVFKLMRSNKLWDLKLKSLYSRAKASALGTIRSTLSLPLERAANDIFGPNSLDMTFDQAIEGFILGQMSPEVMGNFVKTLIGPALDSINGLPGILGRVKLAAQGDCISAWTVAFDIAAGAAALAANVPLTEALEELSVDVQLAVDYGLQYALKVVLSQFLSEILGDSGRSYKSWYTATESTTVTHTLAEVGARDTRLVDPYLQRDRVSLLTRDVGSLGAISTDDKRVSIVTYDPSKLDSTKRTVELGEWYSVNSVNYRDDYVLISGRKEFSDGQSRLTAMLYKYTDSNSKAKILWGSGALKFSAPSQLRLINNGQFFAAQTAAGDIVFFGP